MSNNNVIPFRKPNKGKYPLCYDGVCHVTIGGYFQDDFISHILDTLHDPKVFSLTSIPLCSHIGLKKYNYTTTSNNKV